MKNALLTLGLVLYSISNVCGQVYLKQSEKLKVIADSFFVLGNYAEATNYYKRELSVYLKNKDLHRIAIGYSNISVTDYYTGNTEKAIQGCLKALQILPRKSETDTTRFRIERFLGLYYANSNIDSSNTHYEKAEFLITQKSNVSKCSDIISFYNDLGLKNYKIYNLKKSEIYYRKAINNLSLDKQYNKAVLYYNLGLVYILEKKFVLALNLLSLAEKSVSDKRILYYILKEKAVCLQKTAQLVLAETSFEWAWKTYQSYKNTNNLPADIYFETSYFNSRGSLAFENRQIPVAENYFFKSIQLEKTKSQKSIVLTDNYRRLAEISLNQNQPHKALKLYQDAIIAVHRKFDNANIYQNPQLSNILSERELFTVLTGKAAAFYQLFSQTKADTDLKASLSTYQLAILLAEKIRRSFSSAEAKAFFTEHNFEVYQHAIEVAYHLPMPQREAVIFEIQEKSKAAILSDVSREIDIKSIAINPALLKEEKHLNQQITALQLDLKRQTDTSTITALQKKLTDLEFSTIRLIDRFEKEFPNYYKLKYDFKSLSLKAIQQNLDENTALLYYTLANKKIYISTITHSESSTYQSNISNTFRQELTAYLKALYSSPQGIKYQQQHLSAHLYAQLIEPIDHKLIGKKRLIIIRDAELNYLPFEVLAKQKNDYLLRKFAISYANSATLLFAKRNTNSQDDIFTVAPFANVSTLTKTTRNKNLLALPASAKEVSQIGGNILLNEKATKQRFLEQYQNSGIIHLATHAITNDYDPSQSFIAFYPNNQQFKLTTNEVYNLDLSKSQLVVLSACETGNGYLQKGEGVISLARGFAYAGCPSVITTLWNANDVSSAYLSEKLYEYLKKGYSKDEALREAKIDFLDSELGIRYQHPHYWANFTLIGNSEKVHFQSNWSVWVLIIVGSLLAIFIIRKTI